MAEVVDNSKKLDETSKIKLKGRGHNRSIEEDDYDGRGGIFDRIEQDSDSGPAQCKIYFTF